MTDLKELRMATSQIAKQYAMQANQADTAIEAKDLYDQGLAELKSKLPSSAGPIISSIYGYCRRSL